MGQQETKTVKVLGVIIDYEMKFDEHQCLQKDKQEIDRFDKNMKILRS